MESDGTIYSNGGQLGAPTITHPATGVYCISDYNSWLQDGGPYSYGIVAPGGEPGQITLNPYLWASTCTGSIEVDTFNAGGTAEDRWFELAKLG